MLKTQLILFLYGVMDSLKVIKSYRFFTNSTFEESKRINNYVKQSLKFALYQLGLMFIIDIVLYIFNWFHFPALFSYLVYPLLILLFIENNVRQLVYIGQIAQNCVKVVDQFLMNKEHQNLTTRYLSYELQESDKKGFKTLVDQLKMTVNALIFSFLLLIQTSIIDLLVILFPNVPLFSFLLAQIDYLLYAVYITVGYYSLKIPYKEHLPFYFHQYFGYFVGYSVIVSYILNLLFVFPKLGIVFSLFAPICMLRAFEVDPPVKDVIEMYTFQQNLTIMVEDFYENNIDRQSFISHLKNYHSQDTTYKRNSKTTIGWFSLAKGIRPYVIYPLNNLILKFMKLYSAFIGSNF